MNWLKVTALVKGGLTQLWPKACAFFPLWPKNGYFETCRLLFFFFLINDATEIVFIACFFLRRIQNAFYKNNNNNNNIN